MEQATDPSFMVCHWTGDMTWESKETVDVCALGRIFSYSDLCWMGLHSIWTVALLCLFSISACKPGTSPFQSSQTPSYALHCCRLSNMIMEFVAHSVTCLLKCLPTHLRDLLNKQRSLPHEVEAHPPVTCLCSCSVQSESQITTQRHPSTSHL